MRVDIVILGASIPALAALGFAAYEEYRYRKINREEERKEGEKEENH